VEIFASDQDGDPIEYSLVDGPEGAEIVTEGDSTFFRWTPAEGTADTTVTVRVNDPVQPSLANITQFDVNVEGDLVADTQDPITIPENGTSGRPIGAIETLVDPSTVTFTLLEDGSTSTTAYAVDPETGVITIASTPEQDFESNSSFTLRVLVTDNEDSQNTDTTEITINLLDRNDSPTIEPIGDQSTVADGETELEVEIFASDQDGDPIEYSLVDGPEGAEIVTEGDSTFFRWIPAEGTSNTTVTVRVNDPVQPSLANTTQFVVNVEESDPINPINDTNNGTPVTTSSVSSTQDTGAEFIEDSAGAEAAEAEIILESVEASFDENDALLGDEALYLADADDTNAGSGLFAVLDAEIAEIQALIDAGKDPTLYTPATAAGITQQLIQEASTPEARVAEILSIMDKVTNLIGCSR
jgi:hypothetical protein